MNKLPFGQISNYDVTYLRKAKADAIKEIYKKGIPCKDHLDTKKYEQATVLPCTLTENADKWLECMAGVIDKDDMIIPTSYTWPFTKLNYPIAKDKRKYSEENVIYIGSFRSHWGHFLIDLVPRLWYVLECEEEKIDAYVISGEFYGSDEIEIENVNEFLELLGILHKIKIINVPTTFKTVIIPERSYLFGKAIKDSFENHMFSHKYLKVFDYVTNKALEKHKEKNIENTLPTKIFMTRRSELDFGIELVDSFFKNNGYMIFDPAKVSLSELIVMLNNCKEVAYISGTLQHNMLFAPDGITAIAIESRAYVSPIQIDIDMMKNIHITYIDANYSIIKDFRNHSRLYSYTSYFEKYIDDKKKLKMDILFQSHNYLLGNIKKHLGAYNLSDISRFKDMESDYSGYEIIVCQESIWEIGHKLNMNIKINYNSKFDRESIIAETSILLKTIKVPYRKWQEDTYGNIYQTFCELIKYVIHQRNPKKFMIYPYGRNGLLCKLLLKEVFAIDPIAFDNQICRYNPSVFPLKDMEQMKENESVMILTSSKEECVEEIERYCDSEIIFGPYTVY